MSRPRTSIGTEGGRPIRISSNRRQALCLVLFLVLSTATIPRAYAGDLFRIDFEDYASGPLTGAQPRQSETYRWAQSGDAANIQEKLSHTGQRALELGGRRTTVRRRFDRCCR